MSPVVRRAQTVVLWIATLLCSVSIGTSGAAKLAATGGWDRLFASWGYPSWFVIVIGVVEVLGVVALYVRPVAWAGAFVLAGVMAGAFATLVTHPGSHFVGGRQAPMGATTPAVLCVVLLALGYVRWRQVRSAKLSAVGPTPASSSAASS